MNLENAFVLVIYMPMDMRIEKIIMMIIVMNDHQLMLLLVVVVVVRISAVFSSRRMRRM